ncbi:NADP-dependent oxidoreductase [Streptomyces sp. WAC05374]|uniref:MDR family NADP-dependent oxidoreductase n=1 Tax=Streptomyces sp. WAC05374 TaxID=2487420 RepID=UPI000F8627F8|nr:NADP-dependent oxidoreductase [Streptomyces sp. WAC05374]RST19039.1 NADP-dependent oxidoreductase [Streptomyces sp. WAC05374]TDF36993.1 NADP-dependent oxidoreductase [Streptomyces sp. WAC05374]TDF46488.1 NADP-dependent oxidoreductase [Streptomyces sp. WAC05374]TDF47589.1 NADP-dependent oxidoreductase [Streptomyces sp. WAC05374]
MNDTALTVHQIARPHGFPTAGHFAFVESAVPEPVAGGALVQNLYWSVDPYHREMMDDVPGGFALDAPLEGRTIGRVVASRTPLLAEGEIVFHRKGWRTHAVVTPEEIRRLPRFDGVPLTAYLSTLGGTGLTAYVGLTRIARLQEGEDLFVSAAAGGVGTATGRFARLLGAGRLVGSAGSAAKAAHLVREVGYDAVFDYHDGPAAELLAKAAPDGIDVFVDNVGGEQLAAAVGALRTFGRIVRVGTISQYNTPDAPPPRFDHAGLVEKSLRMEGFLVSTYRDVQEELYEFAVPHLCSGRLAPDETVVDGFDHIVDAFLGMLRGRNTGKIIVRDRTETPDVV